MRRLAFGVVLVLALSDMSGVGLPFAGASRSFRPTAGPFPA